MDYATQNESNLSLIIEVALELPLVEILCLQCPDRPDILFLSTQTKGLPKGFYYLLQET